MKGAWSALEALEKRLDSVDRVVSSFSTPAPSKGREITTVMMQPVRVEVTSPLNLNERVATFYNGDRDEIFISRFAGYVEAIVPNANAPKPVQMMARGADGYTTIAFSDVIEEDLTYPMGIFDFRWNYDVGTRRSRYSRESLSSDSLSGLGDRGSLINFRTPLRIGRGETIEFRVTPLYIDYRQIVQTTAGLALDSFMVVFVGLGYRSAP